MEKRTLLQIKDLSVDFTSESGVVHALQNVSFEVKQGEIVAIVGESGSGKSVTSLSVLQLLPAPPARYAHGEILFAHEDNTMVNLLNISEQKIRSIRGNNIAMIFQEPMTSLNPVYTCGDQVMEAILLHQQVTAREARNKTIELFNKVKLPDPEGIFTRYPHQLSGGQKQRVMIAMAMSCNPSLLIADEPTTALDVTVQKTILLLIKELQQQSGMGVIFITHDLGIVNEIADKVVVMYKGQIVEQGSVDKIYRHPVHPYTQALLACRPALYLKGERLPVVSDFMGSGQTSRDSTNSMRPAKQALVNGPKISTAQAQRESELTSQELSSVPENHQKILIKAEHLKVWFPSKKTFLGKPLAYTKAVDNVSFDVIEGETLGLVGESGCGKSTLGRALLRLIEPTDGKIYFRERDLLSFSPREMREMRKNMQLIFQDPYSSLNPSISIGEAIMEPLRVHKIYSTHSQQKEKVIALLEKVNLQPEHFNRYPHEFSGGQRQRIVIARALALNPSFIICDESVSALDVSVQAQVLNLLSDLKKEFGFTAIFISHDLSVVRYISDRIMVMNKGRIEETGPAEKIYNHPESIYTQQLIASIPAIQ